jgi:hypothetical protein
LDQQADGASLWISQVTRIPPQSADPAVKNYHWLELDMAFLDACDHAAQLLVLRDLTGAIAEGPRLQRVRLRRRPLADSRRPARSRASPAAR